MGITVALKRVQISRPPGEVLKLLEEALAKRKLRIYCIIDHERDMREYGAAAFPAYTVIFGSPALSSMLLGKNVEIALDSPFRIAIAWDGEKSRVVFRDAHHIFTDFRVVNPEELSNLINRMVDEIFQEMAAAAG